MNPDIIRNTSVMISGRSHFNITLNIFHCGNNDIFPAEGRHLPKNDVFSMGYLNEGEGILEGGGRRYKISEGSGFVAFPGRVYTLKAVHPEGMNVTWVSFTGHLVENYLERGDITVYSPCFADPEGAVGEKINRLYMVSHKLPNRYCKMISVLYDIFAYLLDHCADRKLVDVDRRAESLVIQAIDFIESNYAQDISVDQVAELLGIGRKKLYSIFSKVINISPRQYIIFYRIQKACQMLKDETLTIADVSEACGYANQFYFAKEFKRLTGMTPSACRRSNDKVEIFNYQSLYMDVKGRIDTRLFESSSDISDEAVPGYGK